MSGNFKLEYLANLVEKNSKEVCKKIKDYDGPPGRREKWMVENLGSLDCFKLREELPWFAPFEALSAFRYFFESGAKEARYKEDIISVYKGRLAPKYDITLDNPLKELLDSCAPKVPLNGDKSLMQMLPFSFALRFKFILRKPYISKDDAALYVIDNPVRKDWVFKAPCISPGQWKGTLHAAMVRLLAGWWQRLSEENKRREKDRFIKWRLCLTRLFGNEQGVDVDTADTEVYLDRVGDDGMARKYRAELKKMAPEGHRRGRLMFYPTFFDRLGLEVINPHDRETGAGTLPIYFETVPIGVEGDFSLLYVPFDRAGKDMRETAEETAEDLCRLVEGVAYLFTEFGFGAKISSGFGLAKEEIKDGTLAIALPQRWQVCKELCQFSGFEKLKENGKKIKEILQNRVREAVDDAH